MIGPASGPGPGVSERERQLDSAIADYLQAVEAGRSPDRRQFLARHPDFADDLISFFANEDRVRDLAGTMLGRAGERVVNRPSIAIRTPDSEAEPGIGAEFGDYELVEQIAVGGMGIVFKARQKRLNRVVALKTIRPEALRPGDDAIQRFRIEAEAFARLDHPNIVPIFEMGEHCGYPFLSLKLIEGGDLDRHLSRLKGDPNAIARLMVQVAGAVHYAHLRGILHRDLKPSNILVDRRGRPHVTDFGLAKCVEVNSGLTQTGLIIGTPSYMAPEQVSGPRGEVTTAADVYGLGAVLYTMLSGRPPFQADSVYETLQQVREQEPVRPGLIHPAVDRDLEAICLKCLEKAPGQRYASAEAVADDLERWLDGEPIEARAAGRMERAWRWYRRNRVVARLWAGVAVLFLAVPIIAVVAYARQRGLAEEAYSSAQKERAARLLADARAEDIRERLVKMNVSNGVRLMEQGDRMGALPWFAEALGFDGDDPDAAGMQRLRIGTLLDQCPALDGVFSHTRPILWATLTTDGRRVATASEDGTARVWDLVGGEAVTPILAHDGPVLRVEFRGDGGRLVTASADGTVRIWDLEGGRTRKARQMLHGTPVRIALFSPDGRQIVSGGFDGTIRVWDAEDGAPIGLPHRLGSSLLDLAFSPDGTRIATGTTEGRAEIWQLEVDRLRRLALLPHGGPVCRVAFSPDGIRIATACQDGTARVWDGRTGDPLTAPLEHTLNQSVSDVAFSPDGTRIATACQDGTARVWDARTGRLIEFKQSAIGHAIGVNEASFSPEGARVVTAGCDGTARIWDAISGEPLSPPLYHGGSVLHARFTPDGYQVLTVGSDSTARLWDVTHIGGSAVVVEDGGGIAHAAFDPAGRRFATAGGDGIARVWDAATGEPVTPPMRHRRAVNRVTFSPDGLRLASASADGTARVWDAASGRFVTYALPHDGPVLDVIFSPDGTRLATASGDGHARIWDVDTGQATLPPFPHPKEVVRVAFSPDGRWLASASADGTARVWDAVAGQAVLPPLEAGAPVSSVAFRPDGRVLLTACSDSGFAELFAQQWELSTGRRIDPPLRHGDGVSWAGYSPDGRRIATASEDRTARIWDAATGKPLTRPLTHEDRVVAAAFSSDGRRIATSSLDGTARVWDTITGEPLSPPFLHRARIAVGTVAFQPEGRGLLTASMDGTARIWDLPRDDRAPDVLVLHAQVLSGRRIDQTGGAVPLGSAGLLRDWALLREFAGDDRTARDRARARSRIDWHRREARRLEVLKQGTAAAWHLNRLQVMDPSAEGRALTK